MMLRSGRINSDKYATNQRGKTGMDSKTVIDNELQKKTAQSLTENDQKPMFSEGKEVQSKPEIPKMKHHEQNQQQSKQQKQPQQQQHQELDTPEQKQPQQLHKQQQQQDIPQQEHQHQPQQQQHQDIPQQKQRQHPQQLHKQQQHQDIPHQEHQHQPQQQQHQDTPQQKQQQRQQQPCQQGIQMQQKQQQQEQHQEYLQKGLPYFYALCALIVALVVVAVFSGSNANIEKRSDPGQTPPNNLNKSFSKAMTEMAQRFPNQTRRFWSIIGKTSLAFLRMTDPPKPLVILLGGPPSAHSVVNCIAKHFASSLVGLQEHNLDIINSTLLKEIDGHKVKKIIDRKMTAGFNNGTKSILLTNIELLPLPSPLIFYKFCDDGNSHYKNVSIIFTVYLPDEPQLTMKAAEREGEVEKYLKKRVWRDSLKEDEVIQPLMSRITEVVAIVNGEDKDIVNRECVGH